MNSNRSTTSYMESVAPDPIDEALCRICANWCRAMETGEALNRLPDPLYKWRGQPPTPGATKTLWEAVDNYMESQIKGWAHSRGYKTGTHLHSLPAAQQMALMQDLDRAIRETLVAPPSSTTTDTGYSNTWDPTGC